MSCLSDSAVLELIEGQLDEAARGEAERHLDACPTCRELFAELAREVAGTSEAPRSEVTTPEIDTDPGEVRLARGALVGRYVVVDVLGAGGMGVVYSAYDPELDRKIALKLLRTDLGERAQRGAVRARLVREARAMAKVTHANVITVHDVGTMDDQPFVAMELLGGGTLRRWMNERRARGDGKLADALRLFSAAGEGLAAAHAAGIIHRDFKPDNVLLDNAGRVVVTDFGLCAWDPESEGAVMSSRRVDASRGPLTRRGTRMGTPAYMAPEQHDGELVDARSDQFAFSVALYEAVYGEHPFGEGASFELAERAREGKVRDAPSASTAPDWLRSVLLRGLAAKPEDRFPSMRALLDELDRHPKRRRRAIGAGVASAALLLTSAALALAWPKAATKLSPCAHEANELAATWNPERAARIERALSATGKPYARDAWREARAGLDAFANQWTAQRTEACEATRVHRDQSQKTLDLRNACLDRQRRAFDQVARVLETADDEVVKRATGLTRSLPSIDLCSAAAQRNPAEPPPGATRESIDLAEEKYAEATALDDAGKYAAGLVAVEQAVELARATGWLALEARALAARAALEERGSRGDVAEKTAREAILKAEAGRDDVTSAHAWCLLLYIVGTRQFRFDEAKKLHDSAAAAIQRMGGDPELENDLINTAAAIALLEGKTEEGIAGFERVLDATERQYGPADYRVAAPLFSLAGALEDAHRYEKARAAITRAIAIDEKTVGQMHPSTARDIEMLGHLESQTGRYEEALGFLRRGLAIHEASDPPGHPSVALAHKEIGAVLALLGRDKEALDEMNLAVQLVASSPLAEPMDIADVHHQRADFLSTNDRYAEALADLEIARDLYRKSLGEGHPMVAASLVTLGEILLGKKDFSGAFDAFKKSAELYEAASGPNEPLIADGLAGMGEAELGRHHPERALELLERALESRKQNESDPRLVADVELLIAKALVLANKDKPRALELARSAEKVMRKAAPDRKKADEAAKLMKRLEQ